MKTIEKKISIKGIAMTLAFLLLLQSNITVKAQTYDLNTESLVAETCMECGNNSFYSATEYGAWFILEKKECAHGVALYDITEARDIFSVTRCLYCNHLIAKTYLKTETNTTCSNS